MRRVLRLGCLMLIVVGLCSRPAEAGLADWLEELSGPGPFYVDDVNVMGTICLPTKVTKKTPDGTTTTKTTLLRAYDAKSNRPCIFLDFRRFHNNGKDENKDNFKDLAEVAVTAYDFGLTWEVRRPVDIGFGGGVIHFTSKNVLGNITEKTRPTLTLARVQIKPLLFLLKPSYWKAHERFAKGVSILKVYARESVILGTLEAKHFLGEDSAAKSDFKVRNDHVTSMGFLLDFSELLRSPSSVGP